MKILLASYGAAHVRMILPLLPLLKQAGFEPVPLALTTAAAAYGKLKIPHQRITDFVNPEDPEIQRLGAKLMARHHNPASGISEAESMAYLGASMLDLVEDLGEAEAWRRYEAEGLFAFEPVALAKKIIRETGAGAVVATCSPRMESALLRAGVAMDVPSFCLMALFPLVGMRWLSRADNGHFLFAGNERFRRQLMENGRPPESILIVGNPAFDLLTPADKVERRRRLREARGLSHDDIVILWAEQPEPGNKPDWPRTVRAQVCALREMNPRWKPMVRLHPASQIGNKDVMPAGVLVSSREEDATDALLTSDVVITATSTIGYEAALMDKEVIVVKGSEYDALADYSAHEGIYVAEKLTDIPHAVSVVTGDSVAAHGLRASRQALPQPGRFAQTTVDTIARLIADNACKARKAI